jgi:CRISPR/Cas system CSM-associated protein Csm4 (group 5 of RAMP superfamily)
MVQVHKSSKHSYSKQIIWIYFIPLKLFEDQSNQLQKSLVISATLVYVNPGAFLPMPYLKYISKTNIKFNEQKSLTNNVCLLFPSALHSLERDSVAIGHHWPKSVEKQTISSEAKNKKNKRQVKV